MACSPQTGRANLPQYVPAPQEIRINIQIFQQGKHGFGILLGAVRQDDVAVFLLSDIQPVAADLEIYGKADDEVRSVAEYFDTALHGTPIKHMHMLKKF